MFRTLVTLALVALALPVRALEMAHYGRLLDTADVAVEGSVPMKFALWASSVRLPTGETAKWTGTYTPIVKGGFYGVSLGSTVEGNQPIPDAIFGEGTLYLSVEIAGSELAPRLAVGRVPLAIAASRAAEAEHAAKADLATKALSADLASDVACTGCIGQNELAFDPKPADGSVTTQKLATGAVTDDKLAPDSVTRAALRDGEVVDAKVATVSAQKITGLVKASQIETIGATQITGTLKANQLEGISASQVTGTLAIGQLPQSELAGLVTTTVQSGSVSWKPPVVAAPACAGKDGEFQFEKTGGKLWFCINGVPMRIDNTPLYASCKDVFTANPNATSQVYRLYPEYVEALGVDVYCDFTTTRNGSKGWGLLAVVSSDAGSFWTGYADGRISKGTPSPTTDNYLLGIELWRRFMNENGGRTMLAEISLASGPYVLLYPQFSLNASYQYRHAPGALLQHNDANSLATWTGGFSASAAGSCTSTPGWGGQCGYSQFFTSGSPMAHGISSNGGYSNPPVGGVTKKAYWFQ